MKFWKIGETSEEGNPRYRASGSIPNDDRDLKARIASRHGVSNPCKNWGRLSLGKMTKKMGTKTRRNAVLPSIGRVFRPGVFRDVNRRGGIKSIDLQGGGGAQWRESRWLFFGSSATPTAVTQATWLQSDPLSGGQAVFDARQRDGMIMRA